MAKITITDLINGYPIKEISDKKFTIMELIEKDRLLCSLCKHPIRDNYVAILSNDGKIYHPGRFCIDYAVAQLAFSSKEIVFGNVNYISRGEAVKRRLKNKE